MSGVPVWHIVIVAFISVRLEEVKRLLRETNEPIDAIAARCGYENPNYLKNLFKRRFAMTMREFRARANRG